MGIQLSKEKINEMSKQRSIEDILNEQSGPRLPRSQTHPTSIWASQGVS
jgi:hypothetical protein